jgi:hypothetical protein
MTMATMRFPDDDEISGCSWWCEPMHMVERALAGTSYAELYCIEDFMCMGLYEQQGGPSILLSKHKWTRRYLDLGLDGTACRYRAPLDYGGADGGSYVRHANLLDAIAHLELELVPDWWRQNRLRRVSG